MLDSTKDVLIVQHPKQAKGAPLFLIHDGGGTIFSYYFLGDLGRTVYGIPNPRFGSDEPIWENGIPEMARAYAQLIRSKVAAGDILVGGALFLTT